MKRLRLSHRFVFCLLVLSIVGVRLATAQDEKPVPPVGRTYALTNATLIPAPGKKVANATVVVRDGLIVAAAPGAAIPKDAIIIKADSLFVYAGFIDGYSHVGVNKPKEEPNPQRPKDPGNPPAERAGITPQNDVRNWLNPMEKSIEDYRNIGFTVAQVVPYGFFLPGSAATIQLGGKSADDMVLVNQSGLYSELTGAQNVYPNTVMAVMAKWRELYKNASLTKSYQATYAANRNALARPANDRILEAFYPVIDQRIPVVFKAEKIVDLQRVLTLKNDLGFSLTIVDAKEAFAMVPKIKSSGAKLFLSLDLPEEIKKADKKEDKKDKKDSTKTAKPKTAADLEREGLEKRKKEAIASFTAQAAEFNKAGVVFGFSGLSAKPKDIQANLRRMIAAGLPEDAALAALTTSPAQLLGLSDRLGTVEPGKIANLVVTEKSYFNEKSKVRYVFVDGAPFKMDVKETKKSDGKVVAKGTWSYTTERSSGKFTIKDEGGTLSGTITPAMTGKETELKSVTLDGNLLSFSYEIDINGTSRKIETSVKIDGDSIEGTMTAGQFGSFPVKGSRDPKN